MNRKKWTQQTEVTASLLKFREKRKWQIALRRYVLEKNKSSFYAPYFGLDINKFRRWIEIQFDENLNWENFSKAWQFDHIVPTTCFDFGNENDLKLCWNFTNIRVEKNLRNEKEGHHIDVLAAKAYFEDLYRKTEYHICQKMIEKIERIEFSQLEGTKKLEGFLLENKNYLETTGSFSSYDFNKLNDGIELKDIVFEKEFLKKFG
jgi:hypothetical protein